MAITYEWSFPNFECDSENVVKTIHWRYTAVDGEHSAYMYGSCAGSEGMDFDAMTKEHCINCVLDNQDTTVEDMQNTTVEDMQNKTVEEMQSNLSAQIEEQKNPALTSKTKEW